MRANSQARNKNLHMKVQVSVENIRGEVQASEKYFKQK